MSPWTLKVKKNHSFACISLLSWQHSMFFTQIHPNTANTIILQKTSNTILVDVFLVLRLSKFDVLTRNRLMYSGFGICIRAVFQRSSRYSNSLA